LWSSLSCFAAFSLGLVLITVLHDSAGRSADTRQCAWTSVASTVTADSTFGTDGSEFGGKSATVRADIPRAAGDTVSTAPFRTQPFLLAFTSPPHVSPLEAPQEKGQPGQGFFGRDSTTADSLARRMLDSMRLDSLRLDSLRQDSLRSQRSIITDTTYVVYLDSTARMREFTYQRVDSPQVELFPERTYPLFGAVHSNIYRRQLVIDSTGTMVTATETVGGVPMKMPVTLSLHDYIAERRKYELHRMFADEARKTKQVEAKNELGELLSNFTKISIPVPSNPLFSIFGKNIINLNISGAVDIKAGFRNTKSDQTTLSVLDQSRNEPDFSQEVQVTVNGMIGDKLNVSADWNTQRQFEYENQLKIKYTGYDDEVVQSVEAGNVSLQTPSSFIGSSQALFGVKARLQLGPLTLTTLASQKKGQIKEVNVSGGSQEQQFQMRPYEYATNHYFVDLSYQKYYEAYYQNEPPTITPEMQQTQIVEAEVWVQRQGSIPDPNERQGLAYIDLPPKGAGYDSVMRKADAVPGSIETAPFIRLDPTQYELDGDGYLGVLSLNVNVGDAQVVALAYRTADGRQYGEFARDFPDTSGGKRIILKMVKPRNLLATGPAYPTAWNMLLKNIYPIAGIGRNLKQQGFKLDIYRNVPGESDVNNVQNIPLLQAFGLDKYSGDNAQTPTPDGQFDFRVGRTINQARAELIFPYLRPFDTGIDSFYRAHNITLDSTYLFPQVYDTTQTFAQQSLNNRYVIKGTATGDATSRFSLGFNVVEGSVQVLLDGVALTPNVDYTVDYILGEVDIKNERALVPGANLQIKFEQNDLFQLASKTLLGARGELALGTTSKLGFTIMNLNQQTLSDKVRLGEEPSNNTILGVDGATQFDLPFLTRALDALPVLQTREPSLLRVSGEAAYMMPDPNTSKSTIPSDNGEAIAYIDDFEGSRRTVPVGITYTAWTQASPLAGTYWFPAGTPDTTKMFSKAKMVWFNRLPTDVRLTDIYPQKQVGTNPANNMATVLDLRYFPSTRGMFNYSADLAHTLTPTKNWGGVMKPLSVSAVNLLQENISFIEIWMRIDKRPRDGSGKMIIDLGAISERVIPGGPKDRTQGSTTPNSEDLVLSDYPNGTLQVGEDVGLDMRDDNQEKQDHRAMLNAYPNDAALQADPSGDDYYFNNATVGTPQEDYSHLNGTEGNENGPGGRIPDTEDLNANGICDLANSYFEYELPLDSSSITNPYVSGGGSNGWYQYRIPIKDFVRTVGNPSAENVEYIRVAFVDATDTTYVRIQDFNLVGNQWQKVERTTGDTTFSVGVVSIEDNWPAYTSPPGVIRERDKTQPDQNIQANEQSLSLFLNGLAVGRSAEAARFYTFKPLDLFNYKTMKMFVHGDDKFIYSSPTKYDAEMYFRFGTDSLNYYEYREPIRPGWDPANDVVVTFADITALKQGRDSTTVPTPPIPVKGGPPGSTYRVLGNPSLTQVAYFAVGVTNPPGVGSGQPLTGQVWFNELRVISVDNAKGLAYRFDSQLKLADLGNVSFNYTRVDPNFHTLEQQFGSRQTNTSWGVATSVELSRFLPPAWAGTSLPISYSHSEGLSQPKYLPNSDVLVSEAADRVRQQVINAGGTEQDATNAANALTFQSETRHVADTWAAPSLRVSVPSTAWYVRDIINKISLGFTYNKSSDRSPSTVYRNAWSWNARIQYSVSLSPDYYIQPLKGIFDGVPLLEDFKDWRLYYAPANLSWSVSAVRSRDRSLQRTIGAQEIISRNFSASRQMSFSWKLTEGGLLNPSGDYSVSVESSLLNMELDQYNQQRPFSRILSSIFFGDRFINFGQDTRYSQHNQFNTHPVVPNIFGIKKYFDVTFGYGVDYAWQNALTKGDIGKSVGFNNSINLGLTIRLKQMFDPLFADEGQKSQPIFNPQSRGRMAREEAAPVVDTTKAHADTTGGGKGSKKILDQLKNLMKVFIKIPFLDYDNISVNFTQSNSAQNSGIVGGEGFLNFWGRVPFFQQSDPQYGPSRLYQLGLISDPTGRLTNFRFIGTPPFFAWDVEPGIRAKNAVLVNTYRQTNRLTFKTSRALWEGARLDLTWNVGWSYNRTQNIATDSVIGMPQILNTTTTGSVDRSFLTMPDVLFLGMFKTSLKEVSKKYADLKQSGDITTTDDEKLSQAFQQGFEALPFLSKVFGQFYPRVNWSFRWDGLEKLPLFQSFVSRLSMDHAYTSNYTRQYQNLPGGTGEQTTGQHVGYGFSPLVGLNFTFKELAKGSFGATLRYNTNTSYDLTTSSRNIVEAFTQEITFSANYTRRGFEIPLFGLALNNDIDLSMSYSVAKNSRTTYDVSTLETDVTGTPLEGSTRTTLQPRIKYVLSSRVTASVYYTYTKIEPDASGSRIPGSTTNEAGLDVHISIQ
jgi:cell surface protein SprA